MQDARGVDLCVHLRVQPVHMFEGSTVFLLAVRSSFSLFFFNANQLPDVQACSCCFALCNNRAGPLSL